MNDTFFTTAEQLTKDRREMAERIFAEIWINGRSVDNDEDWEFFDGVRSEDAKMNTWTKVIYLRAETEGDPTERAELAIQFEPSSRLAEVAYLNGEELGLP